MVPCKMVTRSWLPMSQPREHLTARRSQHCLPKSFCISLDSQEPNQSINPSARSFHFCKPVKVLGRASSGGHQCPTQPRAGAKQVPLPLP